MLAVHAESIDRYGSRKVKAFFEWSAVVTNRLRASRRLLGATSAHSSTSTIGGGISYRSTGLCRHVKLVKAAFATPGSRLRESRPPVTTAAISSTTSSLSSCRRPLASRDRPPGKGCSYDNAADKPTDKMLKAGIVYRGLSNRRVFQVKLPDYVQRCSNFRIHSMLGRMSPVEFRRAGLTLSKQF